LGQIFVPLGLGGLVRQHELVFANLICRFGDDKVLLNEADDIVFPAFFHDNLVRKFGDTESYFYEVKLRRLGERDGAPELAIAGRFVRETVLKRQQIVRDGRLVESYREMPSAPSAFFVLLLADHRLLYFAETHHAPSLDTFASTLGIFLRRVWRNEINRRYEDNERTRTKKELERETPRPRVEVIAVARDELIAESIASFESIKRVKFKLIKPNDETTPSSIYASVREYFAGLNPERLDLEAADSEGLEPEPTIEAVQKAADDGNTLINVTGTDEHGNKATADNTKFALSVPVDNPPEDDAALAARLKEEFDTQVANGTVKREPVSQWVRNALNRLSGLL